MRNHYLRTIIGSSPLGYWAIEFTSNTGGAAYVSVAEDTNTDIYLSHGGAHFSSTVLGLIKVTNRGTPLWSKKFEATANTATCREIQKHADGGVAGAASWREPGESVGNLAFRVDDDGSRQWAKNISQGGTNSFDTFALGVESSGDCVTAGRTSDTSWGTSFDAVAYRRSNAGSFLRLWKFGVASEDSSITAIDYDSNSILFGIENDTGCHLAATAETSISGAPRKYNDTATKHTVKEVMHTSSGDGIALVQGVSTGDTTLMKVNTTSFDIIWQRKVNTSALGIGLAEDSSGNFWVSTYKSNTVYISKYNSSGTYQEGQTLELSGTIRGNPDNHSLMIDSDDKLILGIADEAGSNWLLRLPTDGSISGTFGDLTITDVTVDDAAGSLIASSGTLSHTTSTSIGVLDGNASGGANVDLTTDPVFTGVG